MEDKEEEEELKEGEDAGKAKRREEEDPEGRAARVPDKVEGPVLLALHLGPGDTAGCLPSSVIQDVPSQSRHG